MVFRARTMPAQVVVCYVYIMTGDEPMSEQDQRGQNEFSGGSRYDCIVVGAGHAGCEAALVAARAGLQVLVLTGSMDAIAWMPCNPAIGGPGKACLLYTSPSPRD